MAAAMAMATAMAMAVAMATALCMAMAMAMGVATAAAMATAVAAATTITMTVARRFIHMPAHYLCIWICAFAILLPETHLDYEDSHRLHTTETHLKTSATKIHDDPWRMHTDYSQWSQKRIKVSHSDAPHTHEVQSAENLSR